MYKTNSQLKQEAKQALSGKWGVAVLMTLLTGVITYTLSSGDPESVTVTITSLIGTLLNVILSVGFLSFFLKICCGQKDSASFKDLFFGFYCHPGKALLLYLLNVLYLLPGTFIYLSLTFVFIFIMFASAGVSASAALYTDNIYVEPAFTIGFILVFLLLTILYIVYAVYIETTYGLVYYLLLDYPDLSVGEIWKRSAQLMKGNRWRKVKLELSFLPWILVSFITLFIGLLWVGVYMNATHTEFYLDLVQKQTAKNQYNTAPNQANTYVNTYTGTDITTDTNLTHDCETTHSNSFDKTDNNYSGINQDTFK